MATTPPAHDVSTNLAEQTITVGGTAVAAFADHGNNRLGGALPVASLLLLGLAALLRCCPFEVQPIVRLLRLASGRDPRFRRLRAPCAGAAQPGWPAPPSPAFPSLNVSRGILRA